MERHTDPKSTIEPAGTNWHEAASPARRHSLGGIWRRALALAAFLLLAAVPGAYAQSPTQDDSTADLCVEVAASDVPAEAFDAVLEAIRGAALDRPLFFPDAAIETIPDLGGPLDDAVSNLKVGVWGTGGSDPVGASERLRSLADQACLTLGQGWAMAISRDLLTDGSWRVVDSAGLEPDLRATIELEVQFHPSEQLVRTVVRFAILGGMSHGTCWVDDGLGIDEGGRAITSDQVFADLQFGVPGDACDRFRAFMPKGGAGGQAIALQPVDVTLEDGSIVRFVATTVEVQDDAIVLAGRTERG